MKIALYIGNHKNDSLIDRIGWALNRATQKGEFAAVTHVEAILSENADGTVTIGSASLRDNGVRTKAAILNPEHWIIADVPLWSAAKSAAWFDKHNGEKYDYRGAFVTWLPAQWSQKNTWFCNQAVAASVDFKSPEIFSPSQFAAIALTIGNDVTEEFFRKQ